MTAASVPPGRGAYVPPWGHPQTRMVLIGEAPAEQEVMYGQPLVGPSGRKLREWWQLVGLSRQDFYIDNVYPFQAPGNQIARVPQEEVKTWMEDLHHRIAELGDPWLIVPLGNYALYALLRMGQVPWDRMDGKRVRAGIKSVAGSIYEYTDRRGRVIKVIPTIHPAAVFREPGIERVCIKNWEKIAAERNFREARLPQRTHDIWPDYRQVEEYVDHVSSLGTHGITAIDIERPPGMIRNESSTGKVTWKKDYPSGVVTCVSVSHDPAYSLSVPTTLEYWKTEEQVEAVWALLRRLAANENEKVFQNGLFDTWHLLDHGVVVNRWLWDSMLMSHALDPSDKHSLGYMVMCDTREPYFKDEAHSTEGAAAYVEQDDRFMVYAGKDAALTRELQGVYEARLRERGKLKFYFEHYYRLFQPLLRLSRHGIRVDDWGRRVKHARLTAEVITLQDKVQELTGLALHTEKDMSAARVQKYLYEVLQLPPQYKKRKTTQKKTLSADEVTLRTLHLQYPSVLTKEVHDGILGAKRAKKLSEFYEAAAVDEDGRLRSSYTPNTNAGRLSSSKNPRGTGRNFQNIDREACEIYLADEGCVGVEVDLSTAESRVCWALIYWLTGNQELYEKACARPSEFDQHKWMASRIFGLPEAEISKEQRFMGKVCNHASERKVTGKTLSENLLKMGFVKTPEECQTAIDAALRAQAGIEEFFTWTERLMVEQRYLEDTWGGRLYFDYDRLDAAAFREGYSFQMQSPIGRLTNQWGLIPLDQWLYEEKCGAVNQQKHDSVFFSCTPEKAYSVTARLVESLEQVRKYPWPHDGVELRIPCEIFIGSRMKDPKGVEWKEMPSREEFDEKVKEVLLGAVSDTKGA